MRSFPSLSLLLAVSSIALQGTYGAPFQRNSLSASFLSEKGLGRLSNKISQWPRGGAEEEGEAEEPETLYLPGLLDVELSASDSVRVMGFLVM